jgi:hypothetical protein
MIVRASKSTTVQPIKIRKSAIVLTGFLLLFAARPALSQIRAHVSVEMNKPINVLTDTSIGIPAVTYDANDFQAAGIPYLRGAGVTAARYPGNAGAADLYHWSTNKATTYPGGKPVFFTPDSSFPNFAQFAAQLGQALIEVNYGSNLQGNGGGYPQEAAAWVAYANGNPASKQPIGKDPSGHDWQTVGYWASLRAAAPLKVDDGLNFLRIHHLPPFGFKLWQVGDEVYNNGYYGKDHTGDPDLHAMSPQDPKDIARLKGNPKLSPSAFANNFNEFAKAMKAVDPSIWIGAALTIPPNPNSKDWAPDWDKDVLKGACANLDFVSLDWTMQPLMPPNWNTLDEASLLSNQGYDGTNTINLLISAMLQDYKRDCPTGHVPRLAFAPAGIATWPKVKHPVVKALWIADFYAQLIESGAANIDWNAMYGPSMLSPDRKQLGPAFYGLEMLHVVAHSPGDMLLQAQSSSSLVAVHAVYRRDGYMGLMLVNKDPQHAAVVKIDFKDGVAGGPGRRVDYGTAQYSAKSGPSVSAFSAPESEFSIKVPPYTITDLLLPRRK